MTCASSLFILLLWACEIHASRSFTEVAEVQQVIGHKKPSRWNFRKGRWIRKTIRESVIIWNSRSEKLGNLEIPNPVARCMNVHSYRTYFLKNPVIIHTHIPKLSRRCSTIYFFKLSCNWSKKSPTFCSWGLIQINIRIRIDLVRVLICHLFQSWILRSLINLEIISLLPPAILREVLSIIDASSNFLVVVPALGGSCSGSGDSWTGGNDFNARFGTKNDLAEFLERFFNYTGHGG